MKPSPSPRPRQRGNAAGKFITLLLVLGLVGLGGWLIFQDMQAGKQEAASSSTASSGDDEPTVSAEGDKATPIEPVTGAPTLEAAGTYQPQNNIVDVDISEYAGYAGLIVANGGLEPNPESFFAKRYGFQVRLKLS